MTYGIRRLTRDDVGELRAWWFSKGNQRLAPLYVAQTFDYVLARYERVCLVSDGERDIAYLDLQRRRDEGRVRLCIEAGRESAGLLAAMLGHAGREADALGMRRLRLKIPRRAHYVQAAAIVAGFEQRKQTHHWIKEL